MTDKVARVVGLSSVVRFDQKSPRSPINRRISIIVMTKQAENSALHTDTQQVGAEPPATAPTAAGAAPPT